MMMRLFLASGAVFGGLSVMAGAFASHALKGQLSDRMLEVFETGMRYQMYHALALILVALLLSRTTEGQSWLIASGTAMTLGVLLFSGSLYALSFTDIKGLGAITPLGGIAFLVGWGCLTVASLKIQPSDKGLASPRCSEQSS
jgi:uncharacterized membrane protein YgdD (TMEM256/DUF423 family)